MQLKLIKRIVHSRHQLKMNKYKLKLCIYLQLCKLHIFTLCSAIGYRFDARWEITILVHSIHALWDGMHFYRLIIHHYHIQYPYRIFSARRYPPAILPYFTCQLRQKCFSFNSRMFHLQSPTMNDEVYSNSELYCQTFTVYDTPNECN